MSRATWPRGRYSGGRPAPGRLPPRFDWSTGPAPSAGPGRTFGIDAIHVWRFEPRGGGTVASMEESFDGLMARVFRRRLQRQVDATTRKGLDQLKALAEGL